MAPSLLKSHATPKAASMIPASQIFASHLLSATRTKSPLQFLNVQSPAFVPVPSSLQIRVCS